MASTNQPVKDWPTNPNVPWSLQHVQNWCKAKFGGKADPACIFVKLMEKVGELAEEIRLNKDVTKIGTEAADCVIVLCHLLNCYGLSLQNCVKLKMQINIARQWTVRPDGTADHVKEGGE